MNKVYIRSSFMDSYNSLPEIFRVNIRETLVEFRNAKLMKSRHPEKLPAYGGMYSLRVDRRYRILMNKIGNGAYVLLLVGPHDVIYDWAEKNKKSINGMSTDPEDYETLEQAMPELYPEPEAIKESRLFQPSEPKKNDLFGKFNDRKLLKGLMDPGCLAKVRSCSTVEDFEILEKGLDTSSSVFLRHLLSGMTIEEALHEINILRQSREEHEAFEKAMDDIRKTFQSTYRNSRFPHITGDSGKFNMIAGAFGSGKTVELIGALEDAEKGISKRDRILFLVSNPDYLADMRSYIRIVTDPKLMDRVDVLDYSGMMTHIMNDCGKRWGFDFRVAEVNDDDDLLDLFVTARESVEGIDLESWDLMHDWEYVVENFGVFTKEEYFATPRFECVNITEEQREKVWVVFEKFMELMEAEKLYSVGYAIHKLMPVIKRKSYKPFGIIFADDIQFLNYLKIEFLTAIQKSPLSAYSIDIAQDRYLHCMNDLTNPECTPANVFFGVSNLRLDREKRKFACPNIPADLGELRTSIKGIEVIPVDSSDPEDNPEFEEKLCRLVRSLKNPEDNVIAAVDDESAEAYRKILEKNGIKSVIVDGSQSYFDYLLDDGIRICTFLRLGCLTFENVIIPDTYEGLLDPNLDSGLEIPDRYWYFDWIERLSYKMMLFGHSVAASRNTTYFFDAKDGESLVRFYKENVN